MALGGITINLSSNVQRIKAEQNTAKDSLRTSKDGSNEKDVEAEEQFATGSWKYKNIAISTRFTQRIH